MKLLVKLKLFMYPPCVLPADELRRIYIIQGANILGFFTMSMYITMYLAVDRQAFLPLVFFLALCLPFYPAAFLLVRSGRHNLGKVLSNFTFTVPLFVSMLLFTGEHAGLQSYFLMFAIVPVLAWSFRQAGYMLLFVGLNLASYIYCTFLLPEGNIYPRTAVPGSMDFFNLISTGIVYLTFLLFLIVFQHRVHTDERELQEKARSMEEQMLKFQELSHMDPLTGLLNRRAMMNALREEASRVQRSGGNFCVIICDIDHFKTTNDTYGHECGDLTLKHFATLLKNSLRESDKICRWGGEEFCILMPDTGPAGAGMLAERLRMTIEETTFVCNDMLLSITVTMGIAAYSPGTDLETTIRRADEAMYSGKREGRNRISLYSGSSDTAG